METIINAIKQNSHPLTNEGLDQLISRIAGKKIVMLGEASHGTHEYYTWRAWISKILIEEHGYNFIAVEGDWPDCYRVNRYGKGYDGEETAAKVLQEFDRWPTWMWANWETAALAEWLKRHNSGKADGAKAGFYGLDVYSLWESMESIISYLKENDPGSLPAAEDAFRCFEPYRRDEGQSYARASMFVPKLCQGEVVTLLKEMQHRRPGFETDHEAAFSNEQNALVAVNAEKYYRAMVEGGAAMWNLRDRHMMDTLNRLLDFHGPEAKAIVWAHNTHIGDARATDMADDGMFNIGELARKEYGETDVALVGFGSFRGTVMAGSSWGAPMEVMPVPEGRDGSWEQLLHASGVEDKMLLIDDLKQIPELAKERIGHRAIGVVYHPGREQWGNYVPSVITHRYDAFVYLDETQALHPLHVGHEDHRGMPDTYPFGM